MEKASVEQRKAALKKSRIPQHVAVIMDGNGRWAKSRNLKRIDGHRAGIETVRRIVQLAGETGIGYLTLYTFSMENWRRPPLEIRGLMKLLADTLEREVPELNKNRVRIQTIGNISSLPKRNRDALEEAIRATSLNKGLTLILALNYGGRDEIVRAIKKIGRKIQSGELKPDDISSELFESSLDTAGIPDPDLLIRTSGEYRISNYLLWQLAYTELWITDVLWPDFNEPDFLDALESFGSRERRFGKTSQQIMKITKKVSSLFVKGEKA